MALFLFGIQVATGILLSLYYKPSPDQAFESVRAIMTEIDFGWLIRSIHSWSANLLIGVLFLHVLTTYMMRAYRGPREITWMTGVALLFLFLAFGFSGYLLPWNQLAFFATRVGTAIVGVVPVAGQGPAAVGPRRRRGHRRYLGPLLRRARGDSPAGCLCPSRRASVSGAEARDEHTRGGPPAGMAAPKRCHRMPFIPHFLLRDMVGWYLALGILAALAALFPWELGQKADPFGSAPAGIKPEWYFLFMFQTLKKLPPHVLNLPWLEGEVLGVLFFGFCGLVVLLVPFLDFGAPAADRGAC